jgi:signal transduction histidine kinase/PAS domain-containing protein/ActR/RegA family two-component response regulator
MFILLGLFSVLLLAVSFFALLSWWRSWQALQVLQSENAVLRDCFAAQSGVGFIVNAADLQVRAASVSGAELLNRQPESLQGQYLPGLFPADCAAELMTLLRATAGGDAVQQAIISHNLPDGRRQHWQFTAGSLEENAGDKLLYFLGTDVSTLVESEQEARQSNQLYLDILENVPCVLFVKDYFCENRYLLASRLYQQQLDLPPGDMIGKCDYDLFSPELSEKYVADDATVMQSSGPFEVVEKFPTANSGIRAYHTTKVRLPRESGDLLLGVGQDVTDLMQKNDSVQRANKALQGYIKQQQVITSCLAYLMVDEDDDTSIQKVLRSFCEHLQASRCLIMICDLNADEMLLAYEHCNNDQPLNLSALETKKIPYDTDWFKQLCDRKTLCYDSESSNNNFQPAELAMLNWGQGLRIKSMYAAGIFFSGRLWGGMVVTYEENNYILSVQDRKLLQAAVHIMEIILQRKRNHLRLEQALLDAQNANEAKSSFLATISHEIRTPLNAIIGFSELLQHGELSKEEYHECVSSINVAGNALLGLINDILDLSKIEADQMVIVPQLTDVLELVVELRSVFRQSVRSKGLYLEIECCEDLPLLELDSLRLRQILFNLIGNAIKFTEYGGVRTAISFQKTGDNVGQLSISVTDTGFGIEPEAQEKIFAPFVQQDAARDSRVFKGTGLGLAISRRLADRMHGQLTVQSTPGQGSTFTLALQEVPISDQARGSNVVKEDTDSNVFPIKALLVDDVAMNLKVLTAMLKKFSVSAVTVESGAEALEKIKQEIPAVVFTDIWMPGMSGCELLSQIKARPEWREVKVVAVTADTNVSDNPEMSDFDAFLLKPVTSDKIHAILKQLAPVETVSSDVGQGV